MKIAHLSDTQIKNFQRHSEYRESYKHLYDSLREKNVDLITIAGDIAHSKTTISPEFVWLCSDYFKNLADIAPTVVIPGNHDGNLNNLSRLDALTPIVENLNHPKLFYYKHSGLYRHSPQLSLAVFSCFDDDWPTQEDLKDTSDHEDKIILGLYHGMVKGAVLQNGQIVEDCPYTLDQFLGIVDYLMMGDIHKMQILDASYRAAYCGSYPQQNFGESIDKGYLLWDIKNKKEHNVDFVKLPNICPYYTIRVPDDLSIDEDLDFQKNSRIRVKSRQLTVVEKKQVKDKVRFLYDAKEVFLSDDVNAHRQDIKILSNATIKDLSDIGVQEKLIKRYLEEYNVLEDIITQIYQLNRKYETELRKTETLIRNVQYEVLSIKWDNIGPYGTGNKFDFTENDGIINVCGRNAVGKSTGFVDVMLYVLFNTNSKRVVKNDHLINEKEKECSGEIRCLIDDKIYKIARRTEMYVKSGKRKKNPVIQGKTHVSFEIQDLDGNVLSVEDGLERADTDKKIRDIFGTPEDFLATAIAPQWRLLEFVDKGATERLRIIARYFDLDIFDAKHKLAKDSLKELKGEMKAYQGRNFDEEIGSKEKEIHEAKTKRTDLAIKKTKLKFDIKVLEEEIEKTLGEKPRIFFKYSEEEIQKKIEDAKLSFVNKHNEIKKIKKQEKELAKKREMLLGQIESFDILTAEKKIKQLDIELIPFSGKKHTYSNCISFLEKSENKKKELLEYPCVKNSDCCMLEEVSLLKEEINKKKEEKSSLLNEIQKLKKMSTERDTLQEEIDEYYDKRNKNNSYNKEISSLGELIKLHQESLEKMREEISNLESDKREVEKNQKLIQESKKIDEEISGLKSKKSMKTLELSHVAENVAALGTRIEFLETEIAEIEKEKLIFRALKDKYQIFDLYSGVMSKGGIVKEIIGNNLGVINSQISKILSNVGFTVELDSSDDGKAIEIYFQHPKSLRRRIELCSGMEKTLSAIAIRAAMVNVTTLPRPNMFVLDEVFSSLDAEYMDAATKMLHYLKTLFDCLVVITHIPGFEDVVDYSVKIDRDDRGYSKICD